MHSSPFFSLWGTLILIFSGCCFNLLEQNQIREEQWESKHGLQTSSYENGNPKIRANFNNGLLNGEFRTWYPNGQLRCVRQYVNGKRMGTETVYYPDGAFYSHGDYRSGNYKTYYPNGQMQIAKDSLEADGTHYYYHWNSAGVLIESVPIVDGKEDGLHQYWSPRGELLVKGMESQGKQSGIWEYYDETGQLVESKDMDQEVPVEKPAKSVEEYLATIYTRDGFAYPSQDDNAMGKEEAVLDWPTYQDHFDQYFKENLEEPKPLNMNEVSRAIGYPRYARDKGIQGNVVMRILVNEEGIPIDNQIITNVSSHLSNQVEFYLMDLRLTPASLDGNPIPFWVNIPFNFKLLN